MSKTSGETYTNIAVERKWWAGYKVLEPHTAPAFGVQAAVFQQHNKGRRIMSTVNPLAQLLHSAQSNMLPHRVAFSLAVG